MQESPKTLEYGENKKLLIQNRRIKENVRTKVKNDKGGYKKTSKKIEGQQINKKNKRFSQQSMN